MDYFEHSWQLLHLFWIAPLFVILAYYASSRRKAVLRKIFGDNADSEELTTLSIGKRLARLWLLFVAIVLLCVAAARPLWGWKLLPFSGRGRDIMIVLDVSKSMLSEDISPTRLKHAKLFVRTLVNRTPGDRYGLISFAGSAFKECPLTMDKTSFFQSLDEATPDSVPLGGTNIERAIDAALEAFKAAESGYRAIVLLTDGDELYGDCSRTVAELKKKKIPLFIVGIGDPSGDGLIKMTGPDGKTTLLRDSEGKLVKSRLNEAKLRQLAKAVPGGIYVRSTETDLGLTFILSKIKELVPKKYSKGVTKRPIEKFHYPLFLAVILLLIRLGIGERRSKKAAAAALAMLVAAFPAANLSAATADQTEAPSLELAKPIETPAEENGKKKKEKEPSAEELYNKGLGFHKKKDLEKAMEYYKKAINKAKNSPEARSKAFQNLGVISHQKGRSAMRSEPEKALKLFDNSEAMYRESMRSDTSRKHVVLNQQKLLDDRELAKKIKKRQDDLRKKRQEARKKTQQALDQQKKENQQQKNNQQKKENQQKQNKQCKNNQSDQRKNNERKNDQRNKNKNDENQKNKQQRDNKQSRSKREQNKRNQNENQNQGQNKKEQQNQSKRDEKQQGEKENERQNQRQDKQNGQTRKNQNEEQERQQRNEETKKKIDEAEKAIKDYSDEARTQKRHQDEANAESAKREIEKAKQEHQRGNGEKAEEHLKEALRRLGGQEKDKQQDKKQNKQRQGKNQDKNGKEKKDKDRNDKGKNGENRKNNPNAPIPKQEPKHSKGEKGEKEKPEKDIDPAQAAALLDLMANQEKTLRDAIKEYQKRNAKVKKVPKDW